VHVSAAQAGALRARLFAIGAVRGETVGPDGSVELRVSLPDSQLLQLARAPGVEVHELPALMPACAPDEGYLQSRDTLRAS
jgi:hypothetical protein